jgi:hypothetical protein
METTIKKNQPRKPRQELTALPGESWRPVGDERGYYHVSNFGRFAKIFQDQTGQNHAYQLNTRVVNDAVYVVLTLKEGDPRTSQAARVVMHVWNPDGNPEGKKYVGYDDGDITNLKPSNLYYATRKEIADARNRLGLTRRKHFPKPYSTTHGEEKYKLVLFSFAELEEIRTKYNQGVTQTQLAKEYGCTQSYISKIILNRA